MQDDERCETMRLRSGKLVRYRIHCVEGELFASVSGIDESLTIGEIEEAQTELNKRRRQRQGSPQVKPNMGSSQTS